MPERVLVVEDDASLCEGVEMVLTRAGYEVDSVADGEAAIVSFRLARWDAIVLDLMLPRVSGFDVCRAVRNESNVPIIMLTARDSTADLVVGLELGADDYITKPFEGPELLARLRAVLRRMVPDRATPFHVIGDLRIDVAGHIVERAGRRVSLTATEFRLLVELVRCEGHVLTRESLLKLVWNRDYLGQSRLVDTTVKRLREKLENEPTVPRMITTVWGVGYCFARP